MMDVGGDEEAQENELLVCQSIYDETQLAREKTKEGLHAGRFQIHLDVPQDFSVSIPRGHIHQQNSEGIPNRSGGGAYQDAYETLRLNYLPPIVLTFAMPIDYPSKTAPTFRISCIWLDLIQLSRLCKELDSIWNQDGPGNVILYKWIQFLKNESFSVLNIDKAVTIDLAYLRLTDGTPDFVDRLDKRVHKDRINQNLLAMRLIEHDQQEKKRAFEKTLFECNVCFEKKRGANCTRFPGCEHVFCNNCVSEYFTVKIKDGAVRALNCPNEKCGTEATPRQVKDLVSADIFEKYDRYLLQSGLGCMAGLLYCPRKTCQLPAIREADTTCAICPHCQFAFCIFCKRSFHGIEPCPINQSELKQLREAYLKASPEERVELEKKYGKVQLKNAMEEMISMEWIDKNAKSCPDCKAHIQKSDGCNKMTCIKCLCYFCWLCGDILDKSNPYNHFNNKGAPCFNRLFEGIDNNEEFDLDDLGNE